MEDKTLLLVDADLLGETRLEPVAARARWRVVTARAATLARVLREQPCDLVLVDLDRGGEDALAALAEASGAGVVPDRVVGYFSHVDEDLGRRARAAGVRALPRGRFWATLDALLAQPEGPPGPE